MKNQDILEAVYDQITVADKNGVFIRISDSCAENFGVPKEKIIGHSCYELEQNGVLRPSITAAVLESQKELNIIQETKSGRRLMVLGKPLFDDKGEIIGVVNLSHDVTQEGDLQNRLKETEEILRLIKRQVLQERSPATPGLLLGCCEKIQPVLKTIQAVAPLNATILLSGESGVGKSAYAHFIHNLGPQKTQPFVQVNCGAIPADLIESELFGYASGAFTGANAKGKSGLLAAAGNGTILLDEISEMPLLLQVKLLHVLQERKYMRVGETTERAFTARVIAASNKDLKELVKKGLFREDLYYRLNVVPITIPPLRERKEDIPLFIAYFLQAANNKYNLHKKISAQGIQRLQQYSWPGNVRELENTVERLVVISENSNIEASDIDALIPEISVETPSVPANASLKEIMEKVEKDILRRALQEQKTTRKVAEALGIEQSTVVKKMKKYNL